jgi:Dolichyl-phosphate-mannose-protein mannosyltransferase
MPTDRTNPVSLTDRRATYCALAITVLAIGLRLHGLADLPLAEDSLYTLRDAKNFTWSIKPVYYAMQSALLHFLPPTPLMLRLPAFVFGVLGVWLTWILGRREFGIGAGLVAAFLVAISPWHLYASQFARYWSLVYLIAVIMYIVMLRALQRDSVLLYILTLLTICLGALTHPTFVFPLPGVFLAVLMLSSEGDFRWTWPSRRARLALWAPLIIVVGAIVGYLLLSTAKHGGPSVPQFGPDLGLTWRLLPAMVQWASPVLVMAALVCAIFLATNNTYPHHRRWGAMVLLGATAASVLLLVSTRVTTVYSDYGISMLPLMFVAIGAGLSTLAQRLGGRTCITLVAAISVLAAGVLPETLSHLSDGTRFDYRPAYNHIKNTGPRELALGAPIEMQRYYAPGLNFEEFQYNAAQLDEKLRDTNGFWLIGSYRRYGMLRDPDGTIQRWVDTNCRVILRTRRPRLDYRDYRVELHWCGTTTAPK